MKILNKSKKIGLYRVIGNNIPDLHSNNQNYDNLIYQIENESNFLHADKWFVLNRLIDNEIRKKIINYLKLKQVNYLEIEFNYVEYFQTPYNLDNIPNIDYWFKTNKGDWNQGSCNTAIRASKNRYLMNNNGARNFALSHGKTKYKWIMPWDGNCFLADKHYKELEHIFLQENEIKYVITPMERIADNSLVNNKSISKNHIEEPQISFRTDSNETFNEQRVYGNQPKVELLKRLGIKGVWDKYPKLYPWKNLVYQKSPKTEKTKNSSAVFRLFTGNKATLEEKNRARTRLVGISSFIDQVESIYIRKKFTNKKIINKVVKNITFNQNISNCISQLNSIYINKTNNREAKTKIQKNTYYLENLFNKTKDQNIKNHIALVLMNFNLFDKGKLNLSKQVKLFLDIETNKIYKKIDLTNLTTLNNTMASAFLALLCTIEQKKFLCFVKLKIELTMLIRYYNTKTFIQFTGIRAAVKSINNLMFSKKKKVETTIQTIKTFFKISLDYDI